MSATFMDGIFTRCPGPDMIVVSRGVFRSNSWRDSLGLHREIEAAEFEKVALNYVEDFYKSMSPRPERTLLSHHLTKVDGSRAVEMIYSTVETLPSCEIGEDAKSTVQVQNKFVVLESPHDKTFSGWGRSAHKLLVFWLGTREERFNGAIQDFDQLVTSVRLQSVALPSSSAQSDIVPPGSIPNEDERKEYERIDKELAKIEAGLADKATLAPDRTSLKAERDKLRAERKKIDSERAKRAVWIPGAMYFKEPSRPYPDFSSPEATVHTVYAALQRSDTATLQASRISAEKVDYSGWTVSSYRVLSAKRIEKADQWVKPGDYQVIIEENPTGEKHLRKMYFDLRIVEGQWKVLESLVPTDLEGG